ncbi:MAG: AI-2E family transporter [Chloroflexota bacterium]
MTINTQQPIPPTFIRKAVIVIGLLVAATFLFLFVWQILDIFMLLFASILLTVFLTSISDIIRAYTPLSHRWALALTTIVLMVIMGIFSVWAAPSVIEQGSQLGTNLQSAIDNLQDNLSQQTWAQPIIDRLPDSQELGATFENLLTHASTIFSRTFGAVMNVVIILFIGFYLAYEPDTYVDGAIKLIPIAYRQRAREVLAHTAYTLRWWLAGRLVTMVIVGVMATVSLYLLDIPLALFLGFLAGFLAFIPVVGPLLALIPPLLIAFTISPTRALYVFLVYMALEILESYLITPVIQRKAVALPPVLLIFLQLILGYHFNLIGLIIAAPAAAVLVVLIKMLYVGDVLGDYNTETLKEGSDSSRSTGADTQQAA